MANLDQNIVLRDPLIRIKKNKYLKPYKILPNYSAKGAMLTQPNVIFENEGINYSPDEIKPKTYKTVSIEFKEKINITDKVIYLEWEANASNMEYKKGEISLKLPNKKLE